MDKSPQPLELAENCDNEETFENVTKNDQDTMSNNYSQRNYAFSQAGTLRRHLKTHRGERPNKCDQCTHLKTHSGIKSSKCNQCNYTTAYASALKTHLTHSGEKCNQCNYASSGTGHLRRHLKVQQVQLM